MEKPSIGPQHMSHFGWWRPPIPWDIADRISMVLGERKVESIGVIGSLSPSVLIAVSYGAPERNVNIFMNASPWDEGTAWNYVLNDTNDEPAGPIARDNLPGNANIHFWDGATPFARSDALFIDLPFSNPGMGVKLAALDVYPHQLLLLGFLEDHAQPDDVLQWATEKAYKIETVVSHITMPEQRKKLEYRLVIASNS